MAKTDQGLPIPGHLRHRPRGQFSTGEGGSVFHRRRHDESPWGVLNALANSYQPSQSHLSVDAILERLERQQITELPRQIREQLRLLPGSGPPQWFPEGNESRNDDADWYCVRTNPFPCPDRECDFVAVTMTAAHRILVWPTRDDPALIDQVRECKACHRNPVVARYEPSMGPAVSYYASERDGDGHEVHGIHRPGKSAG